MGCFNLVKEAIGRHRQVRVERDMSGRIPLEDRGAAVVSHVRGGSLTHAVLLTDRPALQKALKRQQDEEEASKSRL